ncbi:hypothetical protein [Methylobacterium sp.]|uniref:hypothetical protein n=1 Tax=Methylobacterium sp. TaxID=409 RepID=UPI0026014011|nr:hypothetical protein [Methylobacterium sp.]
MLVKSSLAEKTEVGPQEPKDYETKAINYFINFAETLHLTTSTFLSGVSRPSMSRAIRRSKDKLGGPRVDCNGKNSRLTGLGPDVGAEFQRTVIAMKRVLNASENCATEVHRLLDVAVAPTVGP